MNYLDLEILSHALSESEASVFQRVIKKQILRLCLK
jgi:hypothetical protein